MVETIGQPNGEVQQRAAQIWRVQQEINSKLNLEKLSLFEKVGILESLILSIHTEEYAMLKEYQKKQGGNVEIY